MDQRQTEQKEMAEDYKAHATLKLRQFGRTPHACGAREVVDLIVKAAVCTILSKAATCPGEYDGKKLEIKTGEG